MFIIAGSVYLLSVLVIHGLVPQLDAGPARERGTREGASWPLESGPRRILCTGSSKRPRGRSTPCGRPWPARPAWPPGAVRIVRSPYRICPLGCRTSTTSSGRSRRWRARPGPAAGLRPVEHAPGLGREPRLPRPRPLPPRRHPGPGPRRLGELRPRAQPRRPYPHRLERGSSP